MQSHHIRSEGILQPGYHWRRLAMLVVALDLAIVQWKKSNEMSLLDSYERLTFS
jgi:hypothetical protein